jgi:hypothetical protein
MRSLMAATEQGNDDRTSPREIDAISGASMKAQLEDALTQWFHVSEMTQLNPNEAKSNQRLPTRISQASEPIPEFGSLANS